MGSLKNFAQHCIFLLTFLSPADVVGQMLTPMPLPRGRSREWAEALLPCPAGAEDNYLLLQRSQNASWTGRSFCATLQPYI